MEGASIICHVGWQTNGSTVVPRWGGAGISSHPLIGKLLARGASRTAANITYWGICGGMVISSKGVLNALRSAQTGPDFADNILNAISWMKWKLLYGEPVSLLIFYWILFLRVHLLINKIPVLFQMMAWYQTGDKPLSEAMMTKFTYAYMSQSAWVASLILYSGCIYKYIWQLCANSIQYTDRGGTNMYMFILFSLCIVQCLHVVST